MKFVFKKADKKFAQSLSAAVRIGDDLWVGGDEGTRIACLRASEEEKDEYEPVEWVDLVDELDLPDKALDSKGRRSEVDLEGCDWDEQGRYLWVVGSHSLKRAAAKYEDDDELVSDAENLARLQTISADGNRFLLGRVPIRPKGMTSEALRRGAYTERHFGARLECSLISSELLDALRSDPLFGRLLLPGHELPGKDNGLDIEGIAWEPKGSRLLVGLRGPVLRGMAVVLELELEEEFLGADRPGRLRLKRIGAAGQRYRRHFLDLDGLSVRDLSFHGDDLLILAGPTMAIDWPVTIYRWRNARKRLGSDGRFVWQESEELMREEGIEIDPPAERGHDRAEGLSRWSKNELLVVFDSPSSKRWEKPATVTAELIELA
jgi:hypothetical protein